MVAAALTEELSLLAEPVRRVLDGASVAGDPFEVDLAAAAADSPRQTCSTRSTTSPGSSSSERPTCLADSASAIRSCAARSTSPRLKAGESASHERVAAALADRGAPAERPGAPRRALGSPRGCRRGCGAQGGGTGGSLAGARNFGTLASAPRSGSSRPRHPFRSASDCSCRWRRRLPPSDSSREPRDAAGDSRRPAAEPSRAAGRGLGLVRATSSTCSDCTNKRMTGCSQASRALPEEVSSERLSLLIELTLDGLNRMEYKSMKGWAERLVAVAEQIDDPLLQTAGLAAAARGFAFAGLPNGRAAAPRPRRGIIDGLSDAELARAPDAIVDLAGAELYQHMFADASAHAQASTRGRPGNRTAPAVSGRVRDPRNHLDVPRAPAPGARSRSRATSRPPGSRAMPRRSHGASTGSRRSRSPPATSSAACRPRRKRLTSATMASQVTMWRTQRSRSRTRTCSPATRPRARHPRTRVRRSRLAARRRQLARLLPRAPYSLPPRARTA